MISALQRLQSEQQAQVDSSMPDSMTAFGIRGGLKGMAKLFASHPPLEERITALQNQS